MEVFFFQDIHVLSERNKFRIQNWFPDSSIQAAYDYTTISLILKQTKKHRNYWFIDDHLYTDFW